MVEDMDDMVGRLVAALERLELREKTLILFTTDNGSPRSYLTHVEDVDGKIIRHRKPVISMVGDRPVHGGKGSMTDAGCRVPLIANWPGTIPAGIENNDLIDFTDFLPTFAEMAGAMLPASAQADGRSFARRLKGIPGNPREWVFCEHRGRQFVRTHQWKLYSDGRLFDMRRDHREMNPIDHTDQSPQAAGARQQLQDVLANLKIE
jgi:arylsulfatase A